MEPHAMPGSFPSSSYGPPPTHSVEISESSLHKKTCQEFLRNEKLALKTQLQKHMVGQLDALAFVIIIYLLIRHTHFSCYIAAMIDCSVQVLLHAGSFASGDGTHIFESLMALLEDAANRPDLPVSASKLIEFVVKNTKYLIFSKAALTMSYHISNCLFWLRPIASAGRLDKLDHGPLFFVSFLGESTPGGFSPDSPWIVQLWKLGLLELLLLDIVVLLIQLILYQSIYRQSTISPRGLRLNEEEIYILRAKGISGSLEEPGEGDSDILHVKLYETLWDH